MTARDTTAREQQVKTPTAERSGTDSSAGFLEPVREFETSRLGTSPIAFPRSKPDASESYIREFAFDCRGLMRVWVAKALGDWDDVFGLSPETEADARQIADEAARKEVDRDLYPAEVKLLASVVREIVIVKTAMRAATELRACVALLPPESSVQWDATMAAEGASLLAQKMGGQ